MANAYNRNTGRADAEQSAIMKVLRRPVFVDNAMVHGEYTKDVKGHKVSPPKRGDFEVAHDRVYKLVEEEDGARLLHNAPYDKAVFYHDRKLTASAKPPVMMYAEKQPSNRLVAKNVENVATGSRLTLQNLKGKSLNDLGFNENRVRFGQSADVGFRTSDLAMRIVDAGTGSVNSAVVPQKRHSTTFLSFDFADADAISALRYISKHDGQSLRSDRFGNVLYAHQNRVHQQHFLSDTAVTGGSETDNITHAPNRVTVYGKSRANNTDNVVRVDDVGARTDGVVNEAVGGIHVPTASTEAAARRIGQRILATARRAKGNMRLKGVLRALKVRPGDRIQYGSQSGTSANIVLETQHRLHEKMTEVQITSVASGVEDVLQKFQEDRINRNQSSSQERSAQVKTELYSTGAEVDISAYWTASTKYVRRSGMIIGDEWRGIIHGHSDIAEASSEANQVMGLNKSKRIIRGRG